MFTLIQSTPVAGDCIAEHLVIFDKEYTLQEFIDTVLTNKNEWGYIEVVKEDCAWFDYPAFSYRCGEIAGGRDLPAEIYGYKVKSATVRGGLVKNGLHRNFRKGDEIICSHHHSYAS